jgi:chromosome segregation ATPase
MDRDQKQQQDLRDSLEKLNQELKRAPDKSPESTVKVQQLQGHVQQALQNKQPTDEHHRSLKERLQAAVTHLEVEHPSLANATREVIDTLAEMGL